MNLRILNLEVRSKFKERNTTSLHEHYGSKLASYHGQPFVVGQLSDNLSPLDELMRLNTNAAELLLPNGTWVEKSPYPFSDGISKYGMVSTNDSGMNIFDS